MSFITLKCKNCGGSMSLNTESHSATCTHCGSTFILADLLDEQDLKITEATSPKDIEKKMLSGDQIKQGETCLYQAEYEEAEKHFKKAIEYDDRNFRGYLGVVKAKTQNLNVIPDNDDYLEYAKCATQFASFEDSVFVKSELAKIELLKRENTRQKRAKRARERVEELRKNQRKKMNRFFTRVTIIVVVVFAALILLGNFLFSNGNWDRLFNSTIDVSTAQQFIEAMSNEKNMSLTINIKEDLNFDDASISPIGTSAKPFSGKINGNKHTFKNLKISALDSGVYNYYGLFGVTDNANINNLIIDKFIVEATQNSAINSNNCYGTLVGLATNTVISNVEVKNNCSITVTNNNFTNICLGGLVGKADSSSRISNISVSTKIKTNVISKGNHENVCIGGIVGSLDTSYITSCSSVAMFENQVTNETNVKPNVYLGGVVGNVSWAATAGTVHEVVTKNVFSGEFKSECVGAEEKIAAIAANGVDLAVRSSNYCYFKPTKFIVNGKYFSKLQFSDHTTEELFMMFIEDKAVITDQLARLFDAKYWSIVDTTPQFIK